MLSVTEFVVVALIALCSGVVQIAMGFGNGLFAVPLLALILAPHDAVATTTLTGAATAIYQAWSERAHREGAVAYRMLGGAALGVPIGLAFFVRAEPATVRIVIFSVVIIAALLLLMGFKLRGSSPAFDLVSGMACGAFSTSSGTGGPPLVFALRARGLSPPAFRATLAFVASFVGPTTAVLFVLVGDRLTANVWLAFIVGLPGLIAGVVIGQWLHSHLNERRFHRVVIVLLVATAAAILLSSLET